MEKKDLGKTSTGIEANVAGLLCYVLGWVTGLIFFLLEKENKFVRFHALQSMIVFGGLLVAQIVLGMIMTTVAMMQVGFFIPLLGLINMLLFFGTIVAWIVLMIKAYQGEFFKLPVVGDIAEKKS